MTIDLLELIAHLDGIDKRRKERKKRLNEMKRKQ